MFREIRRIKRALSIDEAKRLLKENKRGVLSVNGDDGYPYSIPMSFYYDEIENKIYFHSAKVGHKIDSIIKDNKVCFVTNDDGYLEDGDWAYYVSSCVVFGEANLIDDKLKSKEKLNLLAQKYFPSQDIIDEEMNKYFDGVQMIELDIKHLSAKKIHER